MIGKIGLMLTEAPDLAILLLHLINMNIRKMTVIYSQKNMYGHLMAGNNCH